MTGHSRPGDREKAKRRFVENYQNLDPPETWKFLRKMGKKEFEPLGQPRKKQRTRSPGKRDFKMEEDELDQIKEEETETLQIKEEDVELPLILEEGSSSDEAEGSTIPWVPPVQPSPMVVDFNGGPIPKRLIMFNDNGEESAAAAIRGDNHESKQHWTTPAEERLIELWQEHECLYDYSSSAYHNRSEKERSWESIAESLNMPVEKVKKRAISLRTQYTRLLKPKPGAWGMTSLTPKQNWLLENMAFLRSHVCPRQTQTNQMDPQIPPQLRLDDEEETFAAEADSPETFICTPEDVIPLPQPQTSAAATWSPTIPPPKSSKKRPSEDIEYQKLQLLKEMSLVVSRSKPCRDAAFGQQVGEELQGIKDELLRTRVKRKIMNLLFDAQESEQSGGRSAFNAHAQRSSNSTPSHYDSPPAFTPQSTPSDTSPQNLSAPNEH